jgi:hypothetical protein
MKRTIVAFCMAASVASIALAADRTKPVTLTGCLRSGAEHNSFMLTKVEGTDGPKARGWKTGYLLKRPAKVEIVTGAAAIRPKDHLGRRVTVTGVMDEKERIVKARSIRVHSACA